MLFGVCRNLSISSEQPFWPPRSHSFILLGQDGCAPSWDHQGTAFDAMALSDVDGLLSALAVTGWELCPPPQPTTSHPTEVFKEKVAKPQAGPCLGLPVVKGWFTAPLLAVLGGSSWEMCRFSLWEPSAVSCSSLGLFSGHEQRLRRQNVQVCPSPPGSADQGAGKRCKCLFCCNPKSSLSPGCPERGSHIPELSGGHGRAGPSCSHLW